MNVWRYMEVSFPEYDWDFVESMDRSILESIELDSPVGLHCRRMIVAMHVFILMADKLTHRNCLEALYEACMIAIVG